MQDFEQKYIELLNATASMRRLQKELKHQYSSTAHNSLKRAQEKVDRIIEAEQAKLIKMQQVLNFK